MARLLIGLGIALVLAGLAWPYLGKLPFGRLPGDIVIERGGSRFYFPIMSCVIVSCLVTAILWIFRR